MRHPTARMLAPAGALLVLASLAGCSAQAGPASQALAAPRPSVPTATTTTATTATAAGGTTVPATGRIVALAATQARPLAGRVIVLDPGHNGRNAANPTATSRLVDIGNGRKRCDSAGTQTAAGYAEHAFTWDVALRLRTVLRARGATVILTRPNDRGVGPCITERAAIGNRHHADVALSIHADGGPATGRGFHVIAPARVGGNVPIVAPSRRLATTIRAAFARGTGEPYSTYTGGGQALTVRSDLGGLNLSRVPKVFIECGNMRNRTDAARLTDPAWRQRAAVSLADGIGAFLARG